MDQRPKCYRYNYASFKGNMGEILCDLGLGRVLGYDIQYKIHKRIDIWTSQKLTFFAFQRCIKK